MDRVDYAGNGKINYSEFLAATIKISEVLTYEKLLALFKYFDTDESGTITRDNLREAFKKQGKKLEEKDIDLMLSHLNVKD
jgi:calcium-dependent protein kinase